MANSVKTSDEGSVLPLMIGVIAMLMMVMGALVAIGELTREQRWLHQRADQAVVAASTAIDLDRYYSQGAAEMVPLDAALARSRAEVMLAPARIDSFEVVGDEVRLSVSHEVDLIWGVRRTLSVAVAAKAMGSDH